MTTRTLTRRRHATFLVAAVLLGPGAASCALDVAGDTSASRGDDGHHEDRRRPPRSVSYADRLAACQRDPRVRDGLVSAVVCVGADLFFREPFGGNGRACATCHRVENNFTIDPVFIASLRRDDPLFVAEFNRTLANLERPEQMREFGLILENLDGTDPDPNVRFVLRGVPHNLSMDTSVDPSPTDPITTPADRTGWSGDGAPGEGALRNFQNGAIAQHYPRSLNRVEGVDFRLATDEELDAIDRFMRELGRENELDLAAVAMTDAGAEAGRVKFLSAEARCNGCHGNAGANVSFGDGGNRNFNTGVESSRNPALAELPIDGGFLRDPANADGSFGNGTFNTTPLIEAADTGPFFHTDTSIVGASAHDTASANTIEEAVAFYDTPAFNQSPAAANGQVDLTAEEIDDIARFLRAVNAAFNAQMALSRLDAAYVLVDLHRSDYYSIQTRMLQLALVEIDDAIEVLSDAPDLNADAVRLLQSARNDVRRAMQSSSSSDRRSKVGSARGRTVAASAALGTGLDFVIGDGTVMF